MVQATSSKRLALSFIALALLLISISIVNPNVEAANLKSNFSNKLTNKNDVMAGGKQGAIDLHLKNVRHIAVVNKNKIAAYFPNNGNDNDGKSKPSMKLEILPSNVGNRKICTIPNDEQARVRVTISKGPGGTGVSNSETFNVRNNCNNGNNFYGEKIDFYNGNLELDEDTGLYRAYILVEFLDDARIPTEIGGSDRYSLNYNVRLVGARSNDGILALTENNQPDEFGFRSSYIANAESAGNRQVRSEVVFGYPCTINPNSIGDQKRTVRLYDADDGFGVTYMWVEKNGTPLNRGQYDDGNFNVTNPTAPLVRIEGWEGGNKRWVLADSDGSFNAVRIKPGAIDVTAKYELVVLNTGKKSNGSNSSLNPHLNTLSLSIPYDSINGSDKCNYELKPRVNPPAASNSSVPEGANINVRGHINVIGNDTDSHDWRLVAKVYDSDSKPANLSGASNGQFACSWRAAGQKSCEELRGNTRANGFGVDTFHAPTNQNHSYSTSGLEVGDVVCFVMSVKKPKYNAPNSRWRHSDMKCVGIGGNSDGVIVNPQTYSYYPDLAVEATIENIGDYPKVDRFMNTDYPRNEYEWKLLEAKFTSLPSDIGTRDKGGCPVIQEKSNFISGTCRRVDEGDNLFPNADPKVSEVSKSGSNVLDGPDPIGTWTCYTLSYRTNPEPLNDIIRDIRHYYRDWNDDNGSSEDSRWGDGYREWWVNDYDEDGNLIGRHRESSGTKLDLDDRDAEIEALRADSLEPRYKFTDYDRQSCSVAGIDPKVQIRGHDLQVGGQITTSLRDMTGLNATINNFGSSTEYGVLSGEANYNLASGSGLLSGSSSKFQADWSPLTFTNDTTPFGDFSSVLPANKPSSDNAEVITDDSQIALTGKHIYKVEGTLNITRNLAYTSNYERVSQIPRIIIIAENIVIDEDVTRIDPWLVAANGISTCSAVTTDFDLSPKEMFGQDDLLAINECKEPLVFNGPVYADNLYLYRTGGSRVPASVLPSSWQNPDVALGINPEDYCENEDCGNALSERRRYALSAPAEVFNLRPDAYLSSFTGTPTGRPTAVTDRIIELPPRF